MRAPPFINRIRQRSWLTNDRQGNKRALRGEQMPSDEEIREIFFAGLCLVSPARQVNVQASSAGDALSVFRGSGLEYEESRFYQPGDDPRFINWRLSARSGKLQSKVFREERRRGTLIVIDRRNSMRFGTQKRHKLAQAVRVAAIVAAGSHREHASVETLLFDDHLNWSAPVTTEHALLGLLRQAVANVAPSTDKQREVGVDELLDLLEERGLPGTSITLISDLSGFEERHVRRLMRLAGKNLLKVILLHDAAELQLPVAGRLQFEGAAGRFELDTTDLSVRNHFRQMAEAYFANKQALFRELGIVCVMLSTLVDEPEMLLADGWR
jgi:uncharacterized protein (DUF58 family)